MTEGNAGAGTALPAVSYTYSEQLGLLVEQSTGSGSNLKTIKSIYNKLGQLESYTDADGNTSTYTYDIDGRPETTNDGKDIQTYSYDTTTGELTSLKNTAEEHPITFTATYDSDRNMLSEGYPNGMSANYTYNQADEPTQLSYVKTTHCTTGCTWYSDTVVPSIHSQWMTQTSSLSSQVYKYDNDSRLTQVEDTPAGQGCTTRLYAYDSDSNRMSLTTRNPNSEGKCATEGGTTQNYSYDTADRLNDAGIAYDNFGNITTLPAAAAGGNTVTSTYYQNNTVASQGQAGQTSEYLRDTAGRAYERSLLGQRSSRTT
jgi:YD repeat-containing protein